MGPTAATEDILATSFRYGSSFIKSQKSREKLRVFLFGYPIAHSMAPLLHSIFFKGTSVSPTYDLMETKDTSKFLPALKEPDIIGCAITMPHKITLISSLDDVTEEGRTIGAINTVFLRKTSYGATRYIGTNTDAFGIREAFLQNYPGILERAAGKPGLVIGGGGACRAAIYALWKWMGVSRIYLVNRLENEVRGVMNSFRDVGLDVDLIYVSTIEEALSLQAPTLIVGTVPDVVPREPGEILAKAIVEKFLENKEKGFVLEMCYHQNPRTLFYVTCQKLGWNVLYGTEAMIWQGVAQQALWTELPIEAVKLDEAKKSIAQALEKSTGPQMGTKTLRENGGK